MLIPCPLSDHKNYNKTIEIHLRPIPHFWNRGISKFSPLPRFHLFYFYISRFFCAYDLSIPRFVYAFPPFFPSPGLTFLSIETSIKTRRERVGKKKERNEGIPRPKNLEFRGFSLDATHSPRRAVAERGSSSYPSTVFSQGLIPRTEKSRRRLLPFCWHETLSEVTPKPTRAQITRTSEANYTFAILFL